MIPPESDLFTFADRFFHRIYGRLGHFTGDETLPSGIQDELALLTTELRAGAKHLLESLALSSSQISARITLPDLRAYLQSLAPLPGEDACELILVAPAAHIPQLSAVIQNAAWPLRACTSPGDVRSFLAIRRVPVIILAPLPTDAGSWWVSLLRTLPAGDAFTLIYLLLE